MDAKDIGNLKIAISDTKHGPLAELEVSYEGLKQCLIVVTTCGRVANREEIAEIMQLLNTVTMAMEAAARGRPGGAAA